MSDWYVSRINVREGNKAAGEPGLIAEERVLTIKAPYAAAKRSYEVFKSLGIPDVGLYEWSKNKKSYAASLKSQSGGPPALVLAAQSTHTHCVEGIKKAAWAT